MPHPYTQFMHEAISLAEKGRWATAPNPTVGAVLVRNNTIIASGYHTACGHPHAEIECLRDAQKKGISPADCTLFVTLEPCNHYGKTPPCSQAILDAGIMHVVVGLMDPNPKAKGGAEFLREHGVTVETGICEQECKDLVADFLTWVETPYPYTIVKLASTLDGKIATRTGHSQWISGTESRQRVHTMRQQVDAVIVGGNTFYADNPQLTHRLPKETSAPFESTAQKRPKTTQPLAIIVSSRLPENPEQFTLLTERPEQTIFWTTEHAAGSDLAQKLSQKGITILPLAQKENGLMLSQGFAWLRKERNCLYTLCEGGGKLALSLLEQQLAHEFELHVAPKIVGDSAAPDIFDGRPITHMDEALGMRFTGTKQSGEDIIFTLRRK